jgi:SAM-dependent methyltransferase
MRAEVQQYYGETLQGSADLRTSACCTDVAPPAAVKAILGQVHDEVMARYYGCGLVLPEALDGLRVLDLGCGAGRDCYVLSKLVGPTGHVTGVDATPEQLAVARRHREYHARQFGMERSNVDFVAGDIEHLDRLDLPAGNFDVIVSNCVINLAEDKQAVLNQALRLLKPGGELYFADIYADRRVPAELVRDPVLYGECLSGALYWNDFLSIAKRAGFADPRLVTDRPITVTDAELARRVGNIRFYSATYRLFRIDGLEPACEDYGQAVRYRGTLPELPDHFDLDSHHRFETGRVTSVCGNTWRMLHDTRFRGAFEFFGDDSRHFGIFPGCGTSMPFAGVATAVPGATTCC